MRTVITYLLLCFVIVSCSDGRCLKSLGEQKSETRILRAFDKINVSNKINVYLHTDSTHHVRIRAGENLIDHIITNVSDGWLHISDDNTCDFLRSYDHEVNVHVYSPDLTSIECSNTGNIESIDTIKTRTFEFNQWAASGVNKLLLNVDSALIRLHTGTGDLECAGQADRVDIYAAGYGLTNCQLLEGKTGWVTAKNSGDISVNVSNRIVAFIYGTGNINLFGKPPKVILTDEGEGELYQKN